MREETDIGGRDVYAHECNPNEDCKKHIEMKAVGMAGRYWMTKEINDRMKEQEEVRRIESTNTEAYMSLKVSRLTMEVKRGIW